MRLSCAVQAKMEVWTSFFQQENKLGLLVEYLWYFHEAPVIGKMNAERWEDRAAGKAFVTGKPSTAEHIFNRGR